MLKKDFSGVVVPEVAQARFGSIKEGVHIVVIRDAIITEQNKEFELQDKTAKVIVGKTKPLAIARPAFNQEVTAMVFQLKDGEPVIVDRRSNFGWAKLNQTFVSRKTGEIIMLDDTFVQKHGLKCFDGKYYIPNANPEKETGIEDAAAEAKCFDMLSRVYNACGLVGQIMNPASLIGKEIKIKVEPNKFSKPDDKFGRYKVTGWYPVDAAVATTVEKVVTVAEVTPEPVDLPF